jgi:hypothetical protein
MGEVEMNGREGVNVEGLVRRRIAEADDYPWLPPAIVTGRQELRGENHEERYPNPACANGGRN